MNVTLNLPDEMAEQLMQIAQTNHVSVDELAATVLAGYIGEQTTDDEVDYDLTPEELTELKASFESYQHQKATGSLITQVELNKKVADKIEQIFAQKANTSNV